MPDVFDTLAPDQQQESGDIFDRVSEPAKGDIFDQVGQSSSDTPETDKALNQSREAQRPKVDWNHPVMQGVMDIVKGVPEMVKQLPGMAYQGAKFAVGGPQEKLQVGEELLKQAIPMGTQLAKDVQSPVGSREWTRGILQMAMMGTPGLELLRDLRPTVRIAPEPWKPPPTPPVQRPGTIGADVSRALERRFTMVETPEEYPTTVSPSPTLEETLSGVGGEQRISPETGLPIYPGRDFPSPGIPSETARIGGKPDAIKPSNAQIQARETPQRVEARPASEIQGTSGSDYVERETEGAARWIPQEPEPVPTSKSVAAEAPSTDAPVAEGGPSIRAVSERPIEAPPPGTIRGWEEATQHGENWLNRGGDINKVVTDFRKTGKVNELEMGKMNAYLQRLQSVTNQAGDALRTSPNDPKLQKTYQQAVAQEQTFTGSYKPMHTVASGSLAALQGHVPLDANAAASFTGLSRRFAEFKGKPMTPEEAVKADRISKQAGKSNGEYAKANGEVYKRLDTEYGRIRTTRTRPPTIEDLGKTFGEILDEVCDI